MKFVFTLSLGALFILLSGCATMEDWGRAIKKKWNSATADSSATPANPGTGDGAVVRVTDVPSSEQQFSQADIRKVQRRLKDEGYDPGPVDGVMGPKTREALRHYQDSVGLEKTGVLDDQTAAVLGVN